MAQQYTVQNYINGKAEILDTLELANVRIAEIEAEVMVANEGRFNIIQTLESAKGTMWVTPSDNSQEDGTYMVFNSNFGKHETIKGRTAAFARDKELRDEFLAELAQTPQVYVAPVQPVSEGTQTL